MSGYNLFGEMIKFSKSVYFRNDTFGQMMRCGRYIPLKRPPHVIATEHGRMKISPNGLRKVFNFILPFSSLHMCFRCSMQFCWLFCFKNSSGGIFHLQQSLINNICIE